MSKISMTNKQKQIPFHLYISEYIYQQILDGHYSSGDKLPSERELIKQWKVSRITIRKAIANLVQSGSCDHQTRERRIC